jgi:AAA domain
VTSRPPEPLAFLRRFEYRDHSTGWLIPCPDLHRSGGFAVIVQADDALGRYRFRCVDAVNGDACGNEGDLIRLLGLNDDELRLVEAGGEPRLPSILASEVTMRSIRWREKPLWQTSAFQLLAGAKGAGKGTYVAGLASRITRAGENVIFVSTEDSTEIDLVPRLVAAKAVLHRCRIVQRHVQLPADVDALRELADSFPPLGLLVIDPVANHIGDRNSNSDGEVRDAIAPLNALADDLACLLVGVRHYGKDRSRGALASILGSTAWVDTPRAVVAIVADDEDPRVRHIQVVAGNRSLGGSARAFRLDAVPVAGLDEPITLAVDLGESSKNVDDLLSPKPGTDDGVSDEALQAALIDALETGPKNRAFLDGVGMDAGAVSPNVVWKRGLDPLRKAGRIASNKSGLSGGWSYYLTEAEIEDCPDPSDGPTNFDEHVDRRSTPLHTSEAIFDNHAGLRESGDLRSSPGEDVGAARDEDDDW